MLTTQTKTRITRLSALTLAASMAAPVILVRPALAVPQSPLARFRQMSTKKKVVLLAGAAALLYMYKRHRDAQNRPANVQYYQSKNGRIYYRDPRTHQAHWVTPPTSGIRVPAREAREFQGYQGYNNRDSGRAFGGYGG